jgi:hypothetical protein
MGKHQMIDGESSPTEYLKLGTVITGVILISLLLNTAFDNGGWLEYLRLFMGVFFVGFASFKFAGYSMFALMFAGYDVIAKRYRLYSYLYPFIELGLGILYLANVLPIIRDVVTIVIMGVSVVGVTQELKKRSGIHCACLGNVIKLPLSTVSFIEDAGMGLMAFLMVVKNWI